MADGAVLAVVAVAQMGKPFQPVIFLGRLHEARDILGLERLPESPFQALLRAAVAMDQLDGLTAGRSPPSSEERCVGKEGASTSRTRWWPDHEKKIRQLR